MLSPADGVRPKRFAAQFRIASHDADLNGFCRPSAVLRLFQEACYLMHAEWKPSIPELRERNRAFIVSRTGVEFFTPLLADDTVRAEVWLSGVRGFSLRRWGILTKGNEIAARWSSVWAMTDISDPSDRKLVRPDPDSFGFGTDEPLDLSFPARFSVPAEAEFAERAVHTVTYADADRNRHMNNTVYPDLFFGAIPGAAGFRLARMDLTFREEAPLGEELRLLTARVQDPDGAAGETRERHYVRSLRADGTVNAEAEMILVPRNEP